VNLVFLRYFPQSYPNLGPMLSYISMLTNLSPQTHGQRRRRSLPGHSSVPRQASQLSGAKQSNKVKPASSVDLVNLVSQPNQVALVCRPNRIDQVNQVSQFRLRGNAYVRSLRSRRLRLESRRICRPRQPLSRKSLSATFSALYLQALVVRSWLLRLRLGPSQFQSPVRLTEPSQIVLHR
jgi:hypothetical protein